MTVELVVFDMAGTTVHDGDAVHHCLGDALRLGGVGATRDEINAVMGLPKPRAISLLLERHRQPTDAAIVDRLYADFLTRMLTYYQSSPDVREVAGASQVFRALRAQGIKVALDTGFSRPIADAVIDRLGWHADGLLDATVTSDEVPRGRPYPDLILRAMRLTGVAEAARVAKVGDTPSDLQEGEAAGCGWVVGVTSGSHTEGQLLREPHTHLIPSVVDLLEVLLVSRKKREARAGAI